MSSSVDRDLKAGVKTAWLADTALVTAIPIASVYSGSVPSAPVPPYAAVDVEDIENEYQSPPDTGEAEKFVARRRLIIRLWAAGSDPEEAVGGLVALVRAAFGKHSWTVPDSDLQVSLPEAETHREDGIYQGDMVWRADVPFEVWLTRTLPQHV